MTKYANIIVKDNRTQEIKDASFPHTDITIPGRKLDSRTS